MLTRMKLNRAIFAVAAVCLASAALGTTPGVMPDDRPAYDRAEVRKDGDFAEYLGLLREALERPDKVEVFEGLPHPREGDTLIRERLKKKIVLLFDAEFYAGPARPSVEQGATARVILPEAISEYAGEKKCGGFHADYALRWTDARKEVWTALFCYGCGEVAIFGPLGTLKADLSGPDEAAWREWLAQFDRQRPKPGAR
jgi:hypothetical protein